MDSEINVALVLVIEHTIYKLEPVLPLKLHRVWRLSKTDGETYVVGVDKYGPTCDCGDYVFRHQNTPGPYCKHIKALQYLSLLGSQKKGS